MAQSKVCANNSFFEFATQDIRSEITCSRLQQKVNKTEVGIKFLTRQAKSRICGTYMNQLSGAWFVLCKVCFLSFGEKNACFLCIVLCENFSCSSS